MAVSTAPITAYDEAKPEDTHAEHVDADSVHKHDAETGKKGSANTQLDDAARILAEAGHLEFSAAERKRVLRRIDLFVCVPMCLVYFVQQMDKSTVSYSATFDLIPATGLVGSEYSWLTSVVYLAQLFCQPLSAYALIVFPVKYWVLFNYIAWSAVTMCTAAAHNFTGLVIARILLGAFEATILPSFVSPPRHNQQTQS